MRIGALTAAAATFGAVVKATPNSNPDQVPLTSSHGPELQRKQPNVVFVLTDDQDAHLGSLDYMPLVKKHLLDRGTYFNGHYATTAVCCPSRVTLWTGQLAHNTNVTDVKPPYGGYPKFVAEGYNDNYFPVWLQEAGYNTYYTGKLFNVHTVENYNSPPPGGFTGSDFLLDPHTYDYLNATFQRDGEAPRSYEGYYSTDVLAEKAYGLLDEAAEAEKPFFLVAAPIAPHANVAMDPSYPEMATEAEAEAEVEDRSAGKLPFEFTEPIPAARHRHLFHDAQVPRGASFNPEQASGANWISRLPRQNDTNVEYNDHFYRQRLRSLQAVDELVEGLVARLEARGILENTYFVYSSDNGYHIGQHRLQPGKSCGYEEDVNIPLIVRGPGVAANYTAEGVVSSHADLAPTFFEWLGIEPREDFDGAAIPVTKGEIERVRDEGSRREHVGIEYWGFAMGEGIYNRNPLQNNTYKSLRLSGPGYNLYYAVWCTNEHELYDMETDPGQLHNLLLLLPPTPNPATTTKVTSLNIPLPKLTPRLDALLLVLKTCKADQCRRPWLQLHPDGAVSSLADALAARYDGFYEDAGRRETAKVEFAYCADGFLVDAEGPTWEEHGRRAFAGEDYGYLDGGRWEDWV
ncbi:hypothetical protein M426DRAFT_10012 [Hypoxylon sp. CI-4A]|nr:hypothetical protein M426DRAFT_10012 [Hypoxylon sp. CI-4A]